MSAAISRPSAYQLVTTRFYPLPPAKLYAAFADPKRLARWWGPAGWRNEFHEFDLRDGGNWRFDMVSPDGMRVPMAKTFRVVEPGRRVIIHHEQEGHTFTLEMCYDEAVEAGIAGTRLTWLATFDTAEQLAAVHEPFERGNRENLERLANEVEPEE